jgi:hypothetical protein
MVKRTFLVALSLALLVILVPTFVEADGIPVISAPFVTVGVGDTFTIPISITDATDLEFFQFDLLFAPLIIQANVAGATAGALLPADWFFTSPGFVDNTLGQILGVSAYGSQVSGSGVLADIEFTALSPGVSPLTFLNVAVNLIEPFEIANGQVPVNAVPEPTTLMLLTSGLVLLGMGRLPRRGRRVKF